MASNKSHLADSDEEENLVFSRSQNRSKPSPVANSKVQSQNLKNSEPMVSKLTNLTPSAPAPSVKNEPNGDASRVKAESGNSKDVKPAIRKTTQPSNPPVQETKKAAVLPNSQNTKPTASNLLPVTKKPKTEQQTDTKPTNGGNKPAVKREAASVAAKSDSEDDKPLLSRRVSQPNSKPTAPVTPKPITQAVSKPNFKPSTPIDTKKRPLDQSPKQNGSAKKSKTSSSSKRIAKEYDSSGEEDEDDDDDEHTASEDEEEDMEDEDEEDDVPLSARKKSSTPNSAGRGRKLTVNTISESRQPRSKKTETNGGEKWTTLVHNGVIFPPEYSPHGVKMLYNKKPVDLTPEQEEVATMFAVMRETDYVNKPIFLKNFWNDWKEVLGSNHIIKKLELCDFTPIWEWHVAEKEKKKNISSEQKKKIKEEKLLLEEKYMWALVDGVREKVGNFRVEPPGLFRGRGEHPKMGKLKKRIYPENIVINIGKAAPVPECPIPGHRWKEVRHDNSVTWLAYWNDPISVKECKYVFLAPSSTLKGQSDREKYEKARKLKDYIDDIRTTYTRHFKSDDIKKRQIAVATYLIDRLALRAGNEKDDDEADTVGCCSLKVGHVKLVPPRSLEFDFLGKDSIRYFNTVEVEPAVYKAVGDFQKRKKPDDDIFDNLDTTKLNAHLKEIMPSLTAKVFRTYNASITLDNLLQDTSGTTVQEKIADYQRANKEVAILCNHQRSVSKAHGMQMEKLEAKMEELKNTISELEGDLKTPNGKKRDSDGNVKKMLSPEAIEKKIQTATARLNKMKLEREIKDDMKTVALGTSKINYMDPRITVAWCKLHSVPIEKIFNKSLIAKFLWAMDVEPDYRF